MSSLKARSFQTWKMPGAWPCRTRIARASRTSGSRSVPLKAWSAGAVPGISVRAAPDSLSTATSCPLSPTASFATEISMSFPVTFWKGSSSSPWASVRSLSSCWPSALTVTSTSASGPLESRSTSTTSFCGCRGASPAAAGGSSWSCASPTCAIRRSAVIGCTKTATPSLGKSSAEASSSQNRNGFTFFLNSFRSASVWDLYRSSATILSTSSLNSQRPFAAW